MSFNTIAINQSNKSFEDQDQIWLFAYGSLIFKPDFAYLDRKPASIRGWSRRFWQGSHDHRGTIDAPGRVATLIPEPGATCHGMAYLISPDVFAHLDYREKNGYLRVASDITFDDGNHALGLVYIANAQNAAYLGPAPESAIAHQIAQSSGPSGSNRDYLVSLADALRTLGRADAHVFTIESHLPDLDINTAAQRAAAPTSYKN